MSTATPLSAALAAKFDHCQTVSKQGKEAMCPALVGSITNLGQKRANETWARFYDVFENTLNPVLGQQLFEKNQNYAKLLESYKSVIQDVVTLNEIKTRLAVENPNFPEVAELAKKFSSYAKKLIPESHSKSNWHNTIKEVYWADEHFVANPVKTEKS